MAEDLKNNPSFQCKAYREMASDWILVQDLCKGTGQMRSKSVDYLPREPAEKDQAYAIRLSRAVLFNAFTRTLHSLVGMVFRKEPILADDVPAHIRGREATDTQTAIEGYWENIDNCGAHGSVFAKEVFENAMRDGHAAILVDMPPPLPAGSTLADERAVGRRPYWISYQADQIINWRTEVVNGKLRLAQITLRECSTEADGEYGEQEVVRYRVLRPGEWFLYREVADMQSGYILEASGTTSLAEVPVAVIYGRKTGYLTSQPPLLDLAVLNISHYQKYSDHSTYLHVSSRPILWFRGRDKSRKIEPIGPYSAFDVEGENGTVAFAETTGAALEASRQDIKDIEDRMAALGLSILAGDKPIPETATAELLDHIQAESDLATAARSLQDGLELALRYTVQFEDSTATSGGSVELGATIEELTLTPQELQVYSNQVANKQLSLETLWSMMGRAGKLPEDFDAEAEKAAIEADSAAMAERMLTAFEQGDGRANLDDDGQDEEEADAA